MNEVMYMVLYKPKASTVWTVLHSQGNKCAIWTRNPETALAKGKEALEFIFDNYPNHRVQKHSDYEMAVVPVSLPVDPEKSGESHALR